MFARRCSSPARVQLRKAEAQHSLLLLSILGHLPQLLILQWQQNNRRFRHSIKVGPIPAPHRQQRLQQHQQLLLHLMQGLQQRRQQSW